MTKEAEFVHEELIKTKQRIADHGEVFTPKHIVEGMLNLVREEAKRIDSRFLEPACGEGNFLKQVLIRKLETVQARYGSNDFERRHYALLALMSIYGIEILEDNAEQCRENLAAVFASFINDPGNQIWQKAAYRVLEVNIVQANALTLKTTAGLPIIFPEWGYLGKGKFQRRDFQYESLTQRSSFTGTLLGSLETDEIFAPVTTYSPLSVQEIAKGHPDDASV